MASRLSGFPNRIMDLLRIETVDCVVTIKGKPFHPTAERLNLHAGLAETAQLLVFPQEAIVHHFTPLAEGPDYLSPYEDMDLFPIFYENQDYQIVIHPKHPDTILMFYHENQKLREAVTPVAGTGLLLGHLCFRNEVGFSEFEIRTKTNCLLRVTFEIFPAKMDYRKDYIRLLQEVNEEVYNLAFDFLKKTFLQTGIQHTRYATESEFFAILQVVFQRLMKVVERIIVSPQTNMQRQQQIRPSEKVRKVSHRAGVWLSRHLHHLQCTRGHGIEINGERYWPRYVPEERVVQSVDTVENRLVKWIVEQVLKRLQVFEQQYVQACKKRSVDDMVLQRIGAMKTQIRSVLQHEFFTQIKELQHISITLIMQMAPGYRDVYRIYLLLRKGLSLQNDLYRMSVKDIATLYEYWCFLSLHRLLRQKYEVIHNESVKVRNTGLFFVLNRTRESRMRYRNPKNGEVYELCYNPLYRQVTTNQQPDHVLSLRKKDSDIEYKFVFDAKYRINPALEGTPYYDKYKTPGPEEEDINTMHRYRDAIIYADGVSTGERQMYGAYVLFPYANEEEYRRHRFYRSIEEVNVGGLPFLPGHTKLVEEMLDEMIAESPESSFERAVQVRGAAAYFSREAEKATVLVGSIRRHTYDQLEICLRHHFYHMPLERIYKQLGNIEYVALYQQKDNHSPTGGIHYYAKVRDIRIMKRCDIVEAPLSAKQQKRKDELYVRFEVEEWQEKDIPIVPRGYGIANYVMTRFDVFKQATELPELTLVSEQQTRLWRELRRIDQQVQLHIKGRMLDSSQQRSLEFYCLGATIRIDTDVGRVTMRIGAQEREVSLADLRYRPRKVMRMLEGMVAL